MSKVRVVCISDTHGMEDKIKLPAGDILLHAGDITNIGEEEQLIKFNTWLGRLSFKKIVVIPGNHDKSFPKNRNSFSPDLNNSISSILTNCDLLVDSYTIFNGLKIYGSPWTPWFGGEFWVYNAHRGLEIDMLWAKIPSDIDILVTHGPPYGILDRVPRTSEGQGCKGLTATIERVAPKLHCFGHLHLQGGQKRVIDELGTTFVNAACCDEQYRPIQEPVVVDIEI